MNYNDVFNEQLVKRQSTSTDMIKRVGLVIAGLAIIGVVSVFIPAITVFVAAAVIWGIVILMRRLNVEFEYAFTNGDLDIDIIYNQLNRKHKLTVDVRQFVVMINMQNPNLKNELGNINETKDFGKGVITETSYAAVYEEDGKRIQLIFDPNEQLFNAIKMYIPKKIK